MLDEDVIEESNSPWSSPVSLVTKKDRSTKFYVDYRKLNDLTKNGLQLSLEKIKRTWISSRC